MQDYKTWLRTFVAEKGISTDDILEATRGDDVHMITVEALTEMMAEAAEPEREAMKNALVQIDITRPGKEPVLKFLNFVFSLVVDAFEKALELGGALDEMPTPPRNKMH